MIKQVFIKEDVQGTHVAGKNSGYTNVNHHVYYNL